MDACGYSIKIMAVLVMVVLVKSKHPSNSDLISCVNPQDSFLSNLLRLIHTMKPPKKRKKKKDKDSSAPSQSTSVNLDPIMAERKKRFPGLSIPDNAARAQVLMEPQKGEGHGQDVKVASEALDEVSPSTR